MIETTAYLLIARAAVRGECTARVGAEAETMVVDSASGLGIDDIMGRRSTLDGNIQIARRDGGLYDDHSESPTISVRR